MLGILLLIVIWDLQGHQSATLWFALIISATLASQIILMLLRRMLLMVLHAVIARVGASRPHDCSALIPPALLLNTLHTLPSRRLQWPRPDLCTTV